MSIIVDDLAKGIAARVRTEREVRKWSLADLAKHADVSKAMISKIERGESSPTMAVLGRLCRGVPSHTIDLPDPGGGARRALDQILGATKLD